MNKISISLNLEKRLLSLWYKETDKKYNFNFLLEKLLGGLAKLYSLAIKLRLKLFKWQFLKSYQAKVPVIIVGNITVGGTGKTAFVIALAEYLTKQGLKPGIVTRGYGLQQQRSKNPQSILLTNGINAYVETAVTGDEARLLHNRTGLPVAIGRDRITAAKVLLANNLCNIIISDDGLQHYYLKRDLEICLVDDVRMFGNNKLLPAGPLREHPHRLDNVDFVLLKNHGFIIRAQCFVNLSSGQEISIKNFMTQLVKVRPSIHAYAGLGNNNSFFNMLTELMANHGAKDMGFTEHSFNDHNVYLDSDFDLLQNNKTDGSLGKIIITTEKDSVKIKEILSVSDKLQDIYYLKIDVELQRDFLMGLDIKLNKLLQQYAINYQPYIKNKEVEYVG